MHIRYPVSHFHIDIGPIKTIKCLIKRTTTPLSIRLYDTCKLHSQKILVRRHIDSLPIKRKTFNASMVRKQNCILGSSIRSFAIVCSFVAKPSKNASIVSNTLSFATPPATISQSVSSLRFRQRTIKSSHDSEYESKRNIFRFSALISSNSYLEITAFPVRRFRFSLHFSACPRTGVT